MTEFEACQESLTALHDFIVSRCMALGASRDIALRAALVTEELFLNAVLHGEADCGPVRVDLSLAIDDLVLCFEDAGKPFDPFSHLSDATHEQPVDERPIGGLGVVLIDGLARRREYARAGQFNRVTVWLPRESA